MTLFFALGTSGFIAAYTIVDGFGARIFRLASAYAGLLFLLDALFMIATALLTRGPQAFREILPSWKSGATGALLSAGAYWIVIWAMSLAPIAAVAALRETSILFVMLMSVGLPEREGYGLAASRRGTHCAWRGGAQIVMNLPGTNCHCVVIN